VRAACACTRRAALRHPAVVVLHPYAPRSCVYGVKLLEDWRLLTTDASGYVRLWNCRELVGGREGAPCLTACPSFAPSADDPASALVDPLVSCPGRLVGMWLYSLYGAAGPSVSNACSLARLLAAH